MSYQPSSSGDQYVIVSAAGTTVSSDQPTTLKKVIIAGTYVGSVEWYDTTTAAGTAATNKLFDTPIPAAKTYTTYDLNIRAKTGLVVVATGTPTLVYTKD